MKQWFGFVIFCTLLAMVCACGGGGGGGSDSGGGGDVSLLDIEPTPAGAEAFTAADEEQIYNLLIDYAYSYNQAISLMNATLYADFEKTSPTVLVSRSKASLDALDETIRLCKEIEAFEADKILPIVGDLSPASIMSLRSILSTASPRMAFAADGTGNVSYARQLITMYLDPEYGAKFTLGDIARRTGTSMSQLRFLMDQVNDDFAQQINQIDIDEYEWKTDAAIKVRDTAATTNTALSIVATGGTSAGLLGITGKTIMIVEKASAVITISEKCINVTVGKENLPAVIKGAFKANEKFSSIVLPVKNVATGNIDLTTIQGLVTDFGPSYVEVMRENNQVKVSDQPINPETPKQKEKTVAETVASLLPAGNYQVPEQPMAMPEYVWDGDFWSAFYEGTVSDLSAEAAKLADLWDLASATVDDLTWDFSVNNGLCEPAIVGIEEGVPFFFLEDPDFIDGSNLSETPVRGSENILLFATSSATGESVTSIPQGMRLIIDALFTGFDPDVIPNVHISCPGSVSYLTFEGLNYYDEIQTGWPSNQKLTFLYSWGETGPRTVTYTAYTGPAPFTPGELTVQRSITINVTTLPNNPPRITDFSVNRVSGKAPFTPCFTVIAEDDLYGSQVAIHADFGDGSGMQERGMVCPTYTVPGTYPVSMFVRDYGYPNGIMQILGYTDETNPRKDSGIQNISITVLPPDPGDYAVSLSSSPAPTEPGGAVEGDFPLTVNFSATPNHVFQRDRVAYTWNFGDGSPEVSVAPDQAGYTNTISHTFEQEGRYAVTVTAEDDAAMPATASLDVKVTAPSLQEMIDAAVYDPALGRYTVVIPPGTYRENVIIPQRTRVISEDPEDPAVVATTVIFGDGTAPVVTLKGATVIEGFTIKGGTAGIYLERWSDRISRNIITENNGPGITNSLDNLKTATSWFGDIIDNDIFANRHTGKGGGIAISEVYVHPDVADIGSIAGNRIFENYAGEDGGGVYIGRFHGTMSVNSVEKNVTARRGGGIAMETMVGTLSGNTVMENSSSYNGGGLFLSGVNGNISDNTFQDNVSGWYGGGVYIESLYGATVLENNQFLRNRANYSFGGGAYIFTYKTSAIVRANTVTGNSALSNGGGFYIGTHDYGEISGFTGNQIYSNVLRDPDNYHSPHKFADLYTVWGDSY